MGCTQSNIEGSTPVPPVAKDVVASRPLEQALPRKLVLAGPAPEASDKISNKLALGAGCFWGVQKYVEKGN